MKTRALPLAALLVVSPLFAAWASAAGTDVKLIRGTNRIRVEIGGELFTEYVYNDGSRPYLYPILAADGTSLTRDFPQKDTPGEEHDHPWHRSLWFAHSSVNGVDFWNEGAGDAGKSPKDKGNVVNDQVVETKDGAIGVLHTKNRWVAPDGTLICTDDRVIKFHANALGRFIDYQVTLHALPDKPLLMGDNKDGTMATRLAEWMTMAHTVNAKDAEGKSIKKEMGGTGHIVTATGLRDAKAWGTRADWCEYHADRAGKTYGIAIFDNPKNMQHPTWWMARDYGLFGANPFGWHDYEAANPNPPPPHAGDKTIPAGGSLTLSYRFFFHLGDEQAAKVAEQYTDYAAGK